MKMNHRRRQLPRLNSSPQARKPRDCRGRGSLRRSRRCCPPGRTAPSSMRHRWPATLTPPRSEGHRHQATSSGYGLARADSRSDNAFRSTRPRPSSSDSHTVFMNPARPCECPMSTPRGASESYPSKAAPTARASNESCSRHSRFANTFRVTRLEPSDTSPIDWRELDCPRYPNLNRLAIDSCR